MIMRNLACLIYDNTLTTLDQEVRVIALKASEWIGVLEGTISNSPFTADISKMV